MVKSSSLSSDIDVIREFEELKLKQKLLIESLKRNTDNSQNKLFLEINSKLDFLVRIFTEANNPENEKKEVDYLSKFEELSVKISDMSTLINEKYDAVLADNSSLKEEITNLKDFISNSLNKINIVEKSTLSKDLSQDILSSEHMPPVPDFASKIEMVEVEDKEKPKKKWF